MAISQSDWTEVFNHVRVRVQEIGLRDVDEQVTRDFQATESPALDVQRYLTSLIDALSERSQWGYRKALAALREGLGVEVGGQVEGIDIVFSEHDAALYGVERFDLAAVDNFDPLIEHLKSLRSLLAHA